MKASLLWVALLLSMLFASLANAAAVYTYTGNNFTEVVAGTEYTTSDSVSGSFTVASAFPADMSPTDLREQVLSYSFTDGVNSFNESNSEFCLTEDFGGFRVGTDSKGDLNEWAIGLCSPVSSVPGPVHLMLTVNAGEEIVGDVGFIGTCIEINEDGCSNFENPTEGAQVLDQAGEWALSSQEEEAAAIPALNTRTLILAAILLGLTGLVSVRRRKIMGSK